MSDERNKTVEEIVAELAALGRTIATQNNRGTDQPMFIVQQRYRIIGVDLDYAESSTWYSISDSSEASAEEANDLEAKWKNYEEIPEGWVRTGYHDTWEFVTACFTEQGCKDYLARDGHNLKEPRIYAEGSYRNEEFRNLRKLLIALAADATLPK